MVVSNAHNQLCKMVEVRFGLGITAQKRSQALELCIKFPLEFPAHMFPRMIESEKQASYDSRPSSYEFITCSKTYSTELVTAEFFVIDPNF